MTASDKRTPRRRLAKKKPSERAILAVVRVLRVVDEDSGEVIRIKAMVPAYPLDRKALQDRQLHNNDLVMLDVFKDRNPRFWRLFHALSSFLVENVAELEGLKAHTALKQVQLEARVHCELVEAVKSGSGESYLIWQPKSLNFDETDDTIAQEVWQAMCDFVAKKYFATWDADQVAEAASYWERDQS